MSYALVLNGSSTWEATETQELGEGREQAEEQETIAMCNVSKKIRRASPFGPGVPKSTPLIAFFLVHPILQNLPVCTVHA